MHDQTCGLVDDQQRFVLMHDGEGDILCQIMRRGRLWNIDVEHRPTEGFHRRIARKARSATNASAGNQCLQALARHRRHGGSKRTV